MKFQIPKQQKPSRERIDIKLERSVLAQLERYCQYLDSDRDYVIASVLEVVFKKDKGFVEWVRSHAAAPASRALQSRANA